MSKKIIYFGSIAFFILCSSKIVAQCTLKNGIYVNSSTKGHTIEWQSSNGNNGMGEFIISLTEKFINKKGNWIIEPHFDSMYCEPTGTRISSFGDNNTCIVQIEKQSYRINRKGNIESLLKPVAVLDYSALFNLSGFNTIVTY